MEKKKQKTKNQAISELMNRAVSVHNGVAAHLVRGLIIIFMSHVQEAAHHVEGGGRTQGLWKGVGDGRCLESISARGEATDLLGPCFHRNSRLHPLQSDRWGMSTYSVRGTKWAKRTGKPQG